MIARLSLRFLGLLFTLPALAFGSHYGSYYVNGIPLRNTTPAQLAFAAAMGGGFLIAAWFFLRRGRAEAVLTARRLPYLPLRLVWRVLVAAVVLGLCVVAFSVVSSAPMIDKRVENIVFLAAAITYIAFVVMWVLPGAAHIAAAHRASAAIADREVRPVPQTHPGRARSRPRNRCRWGRGAGCCSG